MSPLDLNGIRLRNRLVTSASLLGYGASPRRLILYGLSPIAQWVPLERFGAVTTRTVTTQPREGHFSLREDWKVGEYPELLRRYAGALRRVDAGWINAFGWCNIGVERYFDEYFPRTHHLNRIVSLGGFSADEFCELVETVNRRAPAGAIAAVEFNLSCHNVNFPFEEILDEVLRRAIPASRHPVIVKLSPDTDYLAAARVAERDGAAALTAINAVKALRLDPRTGEPLLRNRFGSLSGRAIKPIGLRVVAELRDAGLRLPIIATAGIRDLDDCREFLWAGADAVSLGSEAWLAPLPGYALGPARGVRIRRLIHQVEQAEGTPPFTPRPETPATGQGGSLPPPAALYQGTQAPPRGGSLEGGAALPPRYWIGRIEPSMWFEGPSWDALLPADVRVGVLSLGIGRLVPAEIERAHGEILDKVAMLDREGVDVINVGGSPVVSAYGLAGHARLLEEIGRIAGRPFVTSLQAELEALRAVGARGVAIASPYPTAQTAKRVALLEEEGFQVLGHDSLDIERNREIAMLDPERVVRQALEVAERWPAADTIYLPCGSLPVVEVIDRIEAATGRPVVTNVQAQARACLRRLPYPDPVPGFGRLLATTA